MDYRLALMTGIDIPVPECGLILHQPTIKEISFLGEIDFFTGLQTLCLNKLMLSLDETVLESTTVFQIIMMILKEDETKEKKEQVKQFLQLICPDKNIIFTPQSIIIGSSVLDDNNFEAFQEVLKLMFNVNASSSDQPTFNPADAKAAEIAKKIMRGRQRVAAQKSSESSSSLSQYLSTLTVGVSSMSLDKAINLTLYQLYDLIERYSLYINWDIDIRSRLAGGKPEGQPENWMKNIH